MDKYAKRLDGTVISMLHDMHKETVELQWILPTIQKVKALLGEPGEDIDLANVVREFSNPLGINIYSHTVFFNTLDSLERGIYRPVQAICNLYPEHFEGHTLFPALNRPKAVLPRLIQSKYSQKKEYSAFYQASRVYNKLLSGKPNFVGHVSDVSPKEITQDDEWWLTELGLRISIERLRIGLRAIEGDIKAQSSRREVILGEYL